MIHERRRASRTALPDALEATVNDVPVRLLELSAIGARIEHDQRFPLQSPQLRLQWQGMAVTLPIRVRRSQIVAQGASGLIYQSGIELDTSTSAEATEMIAAILRWAEEPAPASRATPPAPPVPATPPAARSLDDTWTRQVDFLRSDVDDDLPFAQFRLQDGGWTKEYVSSPEPPDDGFTIARGDTDFGELQRTYELADPETRRMIRIALQSKLMQRA